jgi:hypothetical protein
LKERNDVKRKEKAGGETYKEGIVTTRRRRRNI